eukprot:CAMPEP_0175150646 /NCGR_PEP_ID=MMETSP0087-20121206/18007_1 /TAXON_ID=136419 /ORGANISM="Unknown Unknown, Strain D1" /LENGTH=2299 /DNA_ID=CAMNT_0016436657 /DNA_START=64 /DNA_END=6963 /DNA_ORIENTATION=+
MSKNPNSRLEKRRSMVFESLSPSLPARPNLDQEPEKVSALFKEQVRRASVAFPRESTDTSDNFVEMSLQQFVKSRGGSHAISRILIANNGIAAVKCIRSIKQWTYETFGRDNVIEFVAMATPEDIKVNAAFIHLADECISVPGGPNNNNYANVQLIVDIAERTGSHAVWAGWGHASENPKLPDALAKTANNIIWIGPPSSAMRALGDKIGSTLIAQSAGVPCMGWSGSGLTVDYANSGIPNDVYHKACVHTVEEALEACERVGFPIMIKASEGGGGKGIRKVEKMDEVEHAYRQVCGEVPGSPIFLMKLAPVCRHLEVQLLADSHGQAIAVFGRDCSIQRRHQKIIEEGPVVAAPVNTWKRMEQSAVRLALEVGYVGAGTVEYLFTSDHQYCFLELNPRLQVEHPVTELISGVNLPASQLMVAMGIPLHRITAVRKLYGADPDSDSKIDFPNATAIPLPGHVIACRVTAENPDEKFQPTAGLIQEINVRSTPDVWGYFSVSAKGGVHEYSDSQFGHMFACGDTREKARRNMVLALKELSIRGDIRTTVEYLRTILEHKEFVANEISTTWLEKTMAQGVVAERPSLHLAVIFGALFRGFRNYQACEKEMRDCISRGQICSPALATSLTFSKQTLVYDGVKYELSLHTSGPESFDISMPGWMASARCISLADDGILVLLDGKKHVVYGQEFPNGLRITADGKTCVFQQEYDPSVLRSNMQGKLIRYLVGDGGHVVKDQPYAEMEVMKMYISLLAPESGHLTHSSPEGSVLEAGDIICRLALDEPDKVKRAQLFDSTFPLLGDPTPVGSKANVRLADAIGKLQQILAGYRLGTGLCEKATNSMMSCLRDPELPLSQFLDCSSSIVGRVPESLSNSFADISEQFAQSLAESHRFYWERQQPFPVPQYQGAIDNVLLDLHTEVERNAIKDTLSACGVTDLLSRYREGNHSFAVTTLNGLLESYLDIEEKYDGVEADDVYAHLRRFHKDDIDTLYKILRCRFQRKSRTQLALLLLSVIEKDLHPMLLDFLPTIRRMYALRGKDTLELTLKARQLLMRHSLPSQAERRIAMLTIMNSCVSASGQSRLERLSSLIDQSQHMEDLIFSFFADRKLVIQKLAIELYVRRAYRVFHIHDLRVDGNNGEKPLVCHWQFQSKDSSNSSPRAGNVCKGVMAYVKDVDSLMKSFMNVVGEFSADGNVAQGRDVLYFVTPWNGTIVGDSSIVERLTRLIKNHERELREKSYIRRVSFILYNANDTGYFTFRAPLFEEDSLVRHIEPTSAMHMHLARLENFTCKFFPAMNPMVHLFACKAKETGKVQGYSGQRMYARILVRRIDSLMYRNEITQPDDDNSHPEVEYALVEVLTCLELAIAGNPQNWRYNHIFINVLAEAEVDLSYLLSACRMLGKRYAEKFSRLNVVECEFLVPLKASNGSVTKYHFYISNPTGYALSIATYREVPAIEDDGETVSRLARYPSGTQYETPNMTHQLVDTEFSRVSQARASEQDNFYNGLPVLFPYPVSSALQVRRDTAAKIGTLYVYDFLSLFQICLHKMWKDAATADKTPLKADYMQSTELILDPEDKNNLKEVNRPDGQNDIGMVAWKITYSTPKWPEPRSVILIANDISFQAGTFGTTEDDLFNLASRYAREHKYPRLYFAANSGARIGMADEVKPKFKVAWKHGNVTRGLDYLYLTESDYAELKDSVNAVKITDPETNEIRYQIQDIIGKKHGLGVENLSGSGLIAGETSQAYEDIFTLTYVTGRTVGIGAYLARLGQRCIQKVTPPILLTGFNALNKLLGREVYSSNVQLGGPDIMYTNGVSHLTVNNDLEGVNEVVKWLDYVPTADNLGFLECKTEDPVDRLIEFHPPTTPYDCRHLLSGCEGEAGKWISGFFDRGSWSELLGGWAKTVVVGRARLGGFPMGVVAVETRTVEQIVPADPANPESKEQLVQKAGQVWYPDSAFKTAQGIRDMIAENIPLIIFANWRGFSGGMRDMFDEVLKFGSYIVDSLRMFNQPIFVYLPPHGTLRGGAWVVVDSTINPEFMDMYAAESASGGVLEPEGTVDVKFRKGDIIKTMHRLDETLQGLDEELLEARKREQEVATSAPAAKEKKKIFGKRNKKDSKEGKDGAEPIARSSADISAAIKSREAALMTYYHTVATQFAHLHDTPGRMLAKGVIEEVIPWAQARKIFYWKLKRKLLQLRYTKAIQAQDSSHDWQSAQDLVKAWLDQDVSGTYSAELWRNDKLLIEWFESHVEYLEDQLNKVTTAAATAKLVEVTSSLPADSAVKGLLSALSSVELTDEQKEELRALLK